ncbi:protein translocase subunit SecF [Georgenia yuyongxinii]|uniref:Protein-export membrane protein SecF n=1 Tax=Georgenia yuyongxinii TaxID=2589797 RepID=A0A5B8C5Q9_9MICO|nr:protein translocase subunit SecF [Georgenia yuyongxinii]QDC24711.1 protein translocase subunit SecF [Georgenia yuyongxinii]
MTSLATIGNELYTGKRSIDFIGKRRTWFGIAGALMLVSLMLVGFKGLNAGIEFQGGSQFTVSGTETMDQQLAHDVLAGLGEGEPPRVSEVGASSLRVQTSALTDEETQQVQEDLAAAYDVPVEDVTATFVGPTWGQSVTAKAVQGLVIFLALVSVVMAAYFRTWTMSLAAIGALIHDLVVTVGVYALVGFEVTPASVIGFLTILGYSLYDTVVVFDKVRENNANVLHQKRRTYAEGANLAVNQTLVRSINTSITGLLPVASILFVGAFLLGAGTLRDISLALFVGMLLSTWSSVFIAAPLEVTLRERQRPIAKHTKQVLAHRAKARATDVAAPDGVDADLAPSVADLGVGIVAGQHLGHDAQPKRKKGRR